MRYPIAILSALLLLAAGAAAGSFTAEMDVDTYVDSNSSNQSFADSDLLWATSLEGEPTSEVYLSFVNLFGSQGIFDPEAISSATLKVEVSEVEKPGEVKAHFLHGATLETANWDIKDEYDEETYSAPVEITEAGSYEFDVTPIIRKAVETCTEGCPFSIVLVAEDDASIAFASSEAGSEPELEYESGE